MEALQEKVAEFVVEYGMSIVGAVLILIVGSLLAMWIGRLVARLLAKRNLEPPVKNLLVKTARVLVLVFVGILALSRFGVDVLPLIAGAGVIGVGLGLAAQGVLSNMVAGLTILFTRPFRVGEFIDIVGEQGVVDDITLFNTTLTHPDRSRVIIPNRKIVGEVLHNYGQIRQLDLRVGVAYDTDLTRAMAVIHDVLERDPRVLKDNEPRVGVVSLDDSQITLVVAPWVPVPDYGQAEVDFNKAIVEAFREQRINIPFPQREVRMLSAG